jgi:tetratricopeptide (TPR) repeat protein
MVSWLLVALAVAGSPEPATYLDPILKRIYDEGASLEQRQQYYAAAVRYRLVMEQVENWRQPALDLARVLGALGRYEEAREIYDAYPDDADMIEAHGRLELEHGDAALAAALFRKLRNLRPEWPGARLLEADARALTEPDLAAGLVEEYLGFTTIEPMADGAGPVAGRVAQGLRARGEHAAAVALLQDVVARVPELEGLLTLAAEIQVDEQARALAAAADLPLEAPQVARLRSAREAFAAGRVAEAREILEALAAEQPMSAVTWGTLADVREAAGDVTGAEQAIRTAERLDPVSASYPAKLGELLLEWYAGRYDHEAAAAFGRAIARRPEEPGLWYRKALAERRAGRWSQSVASFEKVLALEPDGPFAEEARQTIEGASRPRGEAVFFPVQSALPDEVDEEAWWAFHRAWAWTLRSEPGAQDKALRELATARSVSPGFVRALDLEAAIRADRGEIEAAIALVEESLSREPDRGSVVGTLASLYERQGRTSEAAVLRKRAAALGDPEALWRRAQEEAKAWRWSQARATLAEFFAHTTGGADYDSALELDVLLISRIRLAQVGLGATVLLAVALPVVLWQTARRGATVAEWLQRSPPSWRDVARIAAAIRHEVLKHHTTVLPTVADALRRGDPEPPRWLAERLFGPEGALERLDLYVRELELLARASGTRLSLRRRDPVFAPLLRHVSRLRRLKSALDRGSGRRVAARLEEIAHGLNVVAYEALGRLVARASVLKVDEVQLRELHRQVLGEAEFRGSEVELELELPQLAEALYVPLFPSDFGDLVCNLLRNAMHASLLGGAGPVGIGVRVESDPITELEWVVLRVKDRAPGRLTTEALRGRVLSRGLGLVVDLTSRAGGSVRVEEEPGWEKAVVVRLPRAEPPAGEERE